MLKLTCTKISPRKEKKNRKKRQKKKREKVHLIRNLVIMCEKSLVKSLRSIHSWGYMENLILSLCHRSNTLQVHSSVINHTLLYT